MKTAATGGNGRSPGKRRKSLGHTVCWGLLTLSLASCGNQPASVLDPIVLRAKETSLHADRVDWNEVDRGFRARIGDGETAESLRPGLQYLINSLGDKHATIRSAEDGSAVVWYTGAREDTAPPWDAEFVTSVIHDTTAEFSSALIGDDVGYLRVVGIGMGDVDAQARQIREGLRTLDARGVDRWIVDLRYNGGGNMNPMMAGLAPLIGEGFVGGAVDARGETTHRFEIRGGTFFDSEAPRCEMPTGPSIGEDEKVVVLLSRYTISSGELVATAFKGRAHTRFIGERTAGYTTGTGYQEIGRGLLMVISETIFIDRDMNRYLDGVAPDVGIVFDPKRTGASDQQLNAALAWLRD